MRIISINYSSAVGATVKVAFCLFLLGGVDFVIAVLAGTLHTVSPHFWSTSSVESVF